MMNMKTLVSKVFNQRESLNVLAPFCILLSCLPAPSLHLLAMKYLETKNSKYFSDAGNSVSELQAGSFSLAAIMCIASRAC